MNFQNDFNKLNNKIQEVFKNWHNIRMNLFSILISENNLFKNSEPAL